MTRKKLFSIFKKLHKWPGIIIALIAMQFALSGIIMNHRSLFSGIDISRKWLPSSYEYQNWNQAAVRGGINLGEDSILFFGNIGVWLKTRQGYVDYNQGFPVGIDNRKINQLIRFKDKLIAATQFGLFQRGLNDAGWQEIQFPLSGQRLVDLFIKQDSLMILSRNQLIKSIDLKQFEIITLPPPEGYVRNAGLFNTLWELHSGELFGIIGKLFVDLLGLVTIVLSLTGLLHFFLPILIRRKVRLEGRPGNLPATYRLNLGWHNALGYVFTLFLVVNTSAGIFLRPPLLIPIIGKTTGIIPGSHLDNNNPWYDKLRKGSWNEQSERYIFSTSEGFYSVNADLNGPMVKFKYQPPVSLMGCNVLEQVAAAKYLVGSFSGMYFWDFQSGQVSDFFSGNGYIAPTGMSKPVSDHMVTGYVDAGEAGQWVFDYSRGLTPVNKRELWIMPDNIKADSPISLWNLSLEIHTGRILEPFVGMFYILYIPLAGICLLMVLISGFFVWFLGYRRK